MATVMLDSINPGWQVFVGADEAGEISDVGADDLGVRQGALVKRVVRVPKTWVTEASDGVVDLRDDGDTRERLGLQVT